MIPTLARSPFRLISHGSQLPAHGSQLPLHRSPRPGPWIVAPRPWIAAPGPSIAARPMDRRPSPWIVAPRPWIAAPGPWIAAPGPSIAAPGHSGCVTVHRTNPASIPNPRLTRWPGSPHSKKRRLFPPGVQENSGSFCLESTAAAPRAAFLEPRVSILARLLQQHSEHPSIPGCPNTRISPYSRLPADSALTAVRFKLSGFGAASGDRTHDILSHSQAFCR